MILMANSTLHYLPEREPGKHVRMRKPPTVERGYGSVGVTRRRFPAKGGAAILYPATYTRAEVSKSYGVEMTGTKYKW